MLELTPGERAFEHEARRFFHENYPREVIAKLANGERLDKADHVAAQRALNARGWLGVGWPTECGGTGWSGVQRYLFEQEMERAGAAPIIPMGVIYIGPIICAFGSAEQKDRWLPDILESLSFWAQGYSEPEAGSDLASLQFSAVREGDEYVLNGTKIWTSGADMADWIFCLARTSREERKQQGISLICAPLSSPGITVYPIRLIDGSYELSRVEFIDVRVPVANRIGDEGQAWHYANVLLKTERLSYAHVGAKKRDLAAARNLAKMLPAGGGKSMGESPAFTRAMAEVEAQLGSIEAAIVSSLRYEPTMAATAALKIACTECAQAITELFMTLAGRNRMAWLERRGADWAAAAPAVPRFAPAAVQSYFFARAQTIYGGSTEVQKNIIWRWLRHVDGPSARPDDPALMDEQHLLRDAARAAMSASNLLPVATRLGLTSAPISVANAAAVMAEAGRALLREPLAETLLAQWLLHRIGNAAAMRLASELNDDRLSIFAWAEPTTRYDFADVAMQAERAGARGGWRLSGLKSAVRFAPRCTSLLAVARLGDALGLFSVPMSAPGLVLHQYPTIDGVEAADIEIAQVELEQDALLVLGPEAECMIEDYRDRAIALQAAEATGVLECLVEQTVAYTAQRRQFGQAIADFQAVQHRMVDMYRQSELVRAAARQLVLTVEHRPEETRRAASIAQIQVALASRHLSQEAVQLHGGMGMTEELRLAGYVRRATMMAAEWGDVDWHSDRLANCSRGLDTMIKSE